MIYLDFDGTLVDLWPRYFAVFSDLLDLKDLSLDEYKKCKLKYKRDSYVAKCFGKTLSETYFEKKRVLLESREYLMLDSLFISASTLNNFPKDEIMILTKRRDRSAFCWQLDQLDIDIPFCVLDDERTKVNWIKQFKSQERGIIIGDTIADLECGINDFVYPYMVGTGLGSKAEFDKLGITYKFYESIIDVKIESLL